MITSSTNKKVKDIIGLTQKSKNRQKQGEFVIEGVKMFLEAPVGLLSQVFLSEDFVLDEQSEVAKKLESLDAAVSVERVAVDLFKKMSDTKTPQGIMCVAKMPHYDLQDMLRADGLYLILENIQDPGNLGTMFRTGEGAGVDGIVMTKETVDLFNPKTIRSTMGSVYRVPFVYVEDLPHTMKKMQEMGITLYAAHLKGTKYYDEFDYSKGTGFLIGNEGNGLSDAVSNAADAYLKIPMEGKLESLNAAVSAAILMYEAHKKR